MLECITCLCYYDTSQFFTIHGPGQFWNRVVTDYEYSRTFVVVESPRGQPPLDHDTDQRHGRPHPEYEPTEPTHTLRPVPPHPVPHVLHQDVLLDEVIHRERHQRRAEQTSPGDDEMSLKVQRRQRGYNTDPEHHTDRDPRRRRMRELFDDD